MGHTGFQARRLSEVVDIWEEMLREKDLTIVMGYSGSLSVAGQWKIVNWLVSNHFVDIVVPTGANISEDIVEAMGRHYLQGDYRADDRKLLNTDMNRYYDIYGRESDYYDMTELIAEFIPLLEKGHSYTTREFLQRLGEWLGKKGIDSILAVAAKYKVPVYCPSIVDSAFGDAFLLAETRGHSLIIDEVKDYSEFMGLARIIKSTGVVYIGGGVPKDFVQLLAVSPYFLAEDGRPIRKEGVYHEESREYYYPHKYAIQITTDSPQWGGLSGATLDEAISWGKVDGKGKFVQCFCDATIALPLVAQALAERVKLKRRGPNLAQKLND
jgi:deoxyhypusine synthase